MKKFKMPSKSNLTGRISTINNAFAISITPYIKPSEEEIEEMYKNLKLKENECAYCLNEANSMDHLKPLVNNFLPTGYITNIKNLVPCCSSCNSSKGSREFVEWYNDEKNRQRLYKRGMTEEKIIERLKIIEEYEKNVDEPLDYSKILGEKLYKEYKEHRENLEKMLQKEQEFCNKLAEKIQKELNLN